MTRPHRSTQDRSKILVVAALSGGLLILLVLINLFASLALGRERVSSHWFMANPPSSPLNESGGSGGTLWRRSWLWTRPIRTYVYVAKDLGDDCVVYASTLEHQQDYFCACGNRTPLLFASATTEDWDVTSNALVRPHELVVRERQLLRHVERVRFDGVIRAAMNAPLTLSPEPPYQRITLVPEEDFIVDESVSPDALGKKLLEAAQSDSVSVMASLIEEGADVNYEYPGIGLTPLMYARSVAAARLLVEHGANVNRRDIHGENALNKARRGGNNDVADYLLWRGADPNWTKPGYHQ